MTVKKVTKKKKPVKKKAARKTRKGQAGPWPKGKTPPHLKAYQWKPGVAPNPAGKPKGAKSLAKIMRDQMDEAASSCPAIAQVAEALGLNPWETTIGGVLALKCIWEGISGQSAYAKEVLNRLEGVPQEPARIVGISEDDQVNDETEAELIARAKRALARRG